jgi:PKD repeat protein
MIKQLCDSWKLLLALLGLFTLVDSAGALPFVYSGGDLAFVCRKTGAYKGAYEIVVDIGPGINYVNQAAGTTVTITQYAASLIVPDSFANWTNLQWAVVGYSAPTATNYPVYTLWVTDPRVGGVAGPIPARAAKINQHNSQNEIDDIFGGAVHISSNLASGKDNTTTAVQEDSSATDAPYNYSLWMAEPGNDSTSDLKGYGPQDINGDGPINLENITVAPFTSPNISDFYQLVPTGYADPNSGLTTGAGFYVGYFQLNPNGTLTFTRSSGLAGFSGSPTTGSAPLAVTFTDASTGSFTNWLWRFGDGISVTNTSNANVSHTYTSAGSYSVSLTVSGSGGSNTLTQSGYIVVSAAATSTPKFSGLAIVGGQLVLSGTNGTPSTQYRVLTSTNLASGVWTGVYTNLFSSGGAFSYTNSSLAGPGAFFKLVSP